MAHYNKVKGTKFFKDENGTLHESVNGEMRPVPQPPKVEEDEFGMDFLGDKFKEGDKKVESGEISCNLDNPEDCEACGS